MKNGALLQEAEAAGPEVLVTGDRNLSYQQNLDGQSIAIVTLSATDRRMIREYLRDIAVAVDSATPGSFREVACGKLTRRMVATDGGPA